MFNQIGTHIAACVLRQVDPLSLVDGDAEPVADGHDSERYTEGASREGGGYRNLAGPGSQSSAARTLPLPRFDKPRCVSGRLPGGLSYVRATLPTAESPLRSGGGSGSDAEDGGASDDDGGGEIVGGSGNVAGAIKSFLTGAIVVGGGANASGGSEQQKAANVGVCTGEYCIVRVDSLDRVCDVIYCGQGAVEAKNLSKVVGVQLGYLQASVQAYCKSVLQVWLTKETRNGEADVSCGLDLPWRR